MGPLLALLAALGYGISDFLAGFASRKTHPLWVALIGHVVGVTLAWTSLLRFGGDGAAAGPIIWGALSGLGSGVGTLALYRGLARGEMAVAAPLSAVGAAVIPALVGVATGDRLPVIGFAGVVLAIPAIWLMARTPGGDGHVRSGVVDGLVSGLGFALLFIALDRAGDANGLWPVAAGQVAALAFLGATALVLRPGLGGSVTRAVIGIAMLVGVLGTGANVFYFLASHEGQLTIAAVLTSLYPGVTIALAAIVLRERPGRIQLLGLLLGAIAVVAIVTA